ncbi:TolC family protein [Hymenobacter sp. BT770]|uniref:TolC family protein n=1 Tax=Hymenobacter sp. BT770 TaxID=2886942 RepID=UPI001D112928|nr:TolC family protein [Hymenobacter sp. BT770]MCC3155345.1 TolC family protein [Hymenobacter sp. BT770]MDO3417378.1 TolC family protein [Hymenobacter sp. BT770]
MKKTVALIGWLALTGASWAQSGGPALTLADCQARAQHNYPLTKQRELIEKTRDYSVANAAKGYLPQLSFSGQATYQSETINFAKELPAGSPLAAALPTISKDQYKVTGQLDQVLYDGGSIRYAQQARRAEADVQAKNLDVSLYALRERVNQLFFGVLLVDAQLKQTALRRADLQSGVQKTEAQLANGVAFRSSLNELKAELLGVDQSLTQLRATRRAYLAMLGLFINQTLDEQTPLVPPAPVGLTQSVNRPELSLYEAQRRTYDAQENLLRAAFQPRVGAFFQQNYGRPTFNFISNDFGFFWLGGVRLSWNPSSLYTTRRHDVQLLGLSRQNVDLQRETFLFNTTLALSQQRADVQRYQELLAQDEQLVALRASVKTSAQAQLQNGVITSHEYITKVNAEDAARQAQVLHQIQLLQAQYAYQTTSGN